MAKRYGMLPSQVLKFGSSIDIQCANLGIGYENYLNKRAMDRANNKITPDLSVEEMQAMLKAVRSGNENKTS